HLDRTGLARRRNNRKSIIITKGIIMNLKNMIIALIIALLYEILLKLSYILTPSMFNIPIVSGITSVLSFIVGVIIILFVFMFYIEERSNQQLEMVLKILIGCIVLHFILRLPITRNMIDYKLVRLSGQIIGLIQAILYFVLLIFYKREIPSGEKLIFINYFYTFYHCWNRG
ncbi:MAG: hypothetical protein P8Y81_06890, partial [Ignavibacteriaceae bacterium]